MGAKRTHADIQNKPFDGNALAALDAAQAILRELGGTIQFWSKGAERLYGWARDEAVGRISHELLATEFPGSLATIQANLLSDGEWHGELRHRARDGRTVHVASHWTLQVGADGRPSGIIEINNDITRQREGFAAIRRLAAIVESSSDAVIGKNLDGIVTDWNRAAETMFGYRADEMIGRSILLLFPPDRAEEEADIMRLIHRAEGVSRMESYRRRKDGSTFPVAVTVSPIYDESGTITGASTIVRDLTDRELQQQRLREAQSELYHAQRLNEVGQLVTALVHEVNQPLAAIGNYTNAGKRLLAAGNTTATQTVLEKVSEQTERAHQIIQRLRNFVRKGESEQQAADLASIINEAAALTTVSLKRDPVTLTTRVDPGLGAVIADRVQIQQVLFNLTRNAAEAMETTARREIVITAMPTVAGMVRVEVADTGPGLAAEVRANLFRPFVTTKASGLGIGLSICRSIIEAHGGQLWAEDNPGGGTVFCFTLTRAMREVATEAG